MTFHPFQQVAVIGAGTMGVGIARALGMCGVRVRMCDRDLARARAGRLSVVEALAGHGYEPDSLEIDAAEDIDNAVQHAELVVEAVPESRSLKRSVWTQISASAPASALLASNTSSFDIDDLAQSVTDPHRFVGMHWYNPAYLVPCVEVVVGARSSRTSIDRLVDFCRWLGKAPVVTANTAGFVGNRLQFAMIAEAFRCLDEGVASAEDIDSIVRNSFGFRLGEYGPFEVADMAGLDVYQSILAYLSAKLGDRFDPPSGLRELVGQGHLGLKSGAGVYSWPADKADAVRAERDRRLAARIGRPDHPRSDLTAE